MKIQFHNGKAGKAAALPKFSDMYIKTISIMEGRLCSPNGFASSKSFSDYAPAVHIIMILFAIEWSAKFVICPLLSANQIQQKDAKLLAIIAQKDYLLYFLI